MDINTKEENYEEFALAIVRQAVDDYRNALRFMRSRGRTSRCKQLVDKYKDGVKLSASEMTHWVYPYIRAKKYITECEQFFRSSEMELYAPGISGEAVISEMRERYAASLPNYYEDYKNGKS